MGGEPALPNKPLFRTQEIVHSPYAIALALFFAVRSLVTTRTFCSSSLLILPIDTMSYLTCSNRLRSRCLSSRRWRSVSPSTSDHSPSSLRSECFPFASSQTSPISSAYKCPAKFEVHVDIRMRKTVPARRGVTLKVRNEEMEMRKWGNGN